MLQEDMQIPPHLVELVSWFVATVTPLVEQGGWSVTVNGNAGSVQTDVRQTVRAVVENGESRMEKRHIRNFRVTTPLKPRGIE